MINNRKDEFYVVSGDLMDKTVQLYEIVYDQILHLLPIYLSSILIQVVQILHQKHRLHIKHSLIRDERLFYYKDSFKWVVCNLFLILFLIFVWNRICWHVAHQRWLKNERRTFYALGVQFYYLTHYITKILHYGRRAINPLISAVI
jgi:hypothetical protein